MGANRSQGVEEEDFMQEGDPECMGERKCRHRRLHSTTLQEEQGLQRVQNRDWVLEQRLVSGAVHCMAAGTMEETNEAYDRTGLCFRQSCLRAT